MKITSKGLWRTLYFISVQFFWFVYADMHHVGPDEYALGILAIMLVTPIAFKLYDR